MSTTTFYKSRFVIFRPAMNGEWIITKNLIDVERGHLPSNSQIVMVRNEQVEYGFFRTLSETKILLHFIAISQVSDSRTVWAILCISFSCGAVDCVRGRDVIPHSWQNFSLKLHLTIIAFFRGFKWNREMFNMQNFHNWKQWIRVWK